MKKTVITFGLISGALSALMMSAALIFRERIGFDHGLIVGYTVIVLCCLLVYPGIRSYRDNVGGGQITFGRAFAVGILITLISSICYVVGWEILYFGFMPDFCDTYSAHMVEKARASGAGPQAIEAILLQMKSMKAILDNPFKNAAFSFIEPFPIGLLITLLSAAILRKRSSANSTEEEVGAAPSVAGAS